MLNGNGFTAGGYNYTVKHAAFHLAKSLMDAQRASRIETICRKVADNLTGEGWEILGPPLVIQPKVINEALERPTVYSGPAGGLWHPRQLWLEGTIPADHPLVRNEEVLYLARFPVKRVIKELKVEIPDMAIRYWKETQDPILDKLKFDDWS